MPMQKTGEIVLELNHETTCHSDSKREEVSPPIVTPSEKN